MLVIRDDDTSFWTKPEELEMVYGPLWNKGYKISLAVIPYAFNATERGNRRKMWQSDDQHFVYENKELVEFLKPKIKAGLVEIMLHGFDHGYYINYNGKKVYLNKRLRENIDNNKDYEFLPECIRKSPDQLKIELEKGRSILEQTFETKVNVFVPPSNALSLEAAKVLADMGMNISGTILPSFNRKRNLIGCVNYLKKMLWKICNKEYTYPYILNYKTHLELIGHSFTPNIDFEIYMKQFYFTKKKKCDFVLATHYWELIDNNSLHQKMFELLERGNVEAKDSATMTYIFHSYSKKSN